MKKQIQLGSRADEFNLQPSDYESNMLNFLFRLP